MMLMKKLLNAKLLKTWDYIFHYDLNLFKTVVFNLKVFGLKLGWKMPVYLFGKVKLLNAQKGCMMLSSYSNCCVKIGGGMNCMIYGKRSLYPSVINIKGKVFFGRQVLLNSGVVLSVGKFGRLTMGDNVAFNVNCRIFCEKEITIDNSTRISWDTQIFDTNFHYTTKSGIIKPQNSPIHIGHHVWIGNRVTISKGVTIPNFCVVSANSFVNKDFSKNEEQSLIGGIPARLICSDIERIFSFGFENWLDNYFNGITNEMAENENLFEKYNRERSQNK